MICISIKFNNISETLLFAKSETRHEKYEKVGKLSNAWLTRYGTRRATGVSGGSCRTTKKGI